MYSQLFWFFVSFVVGAATVAVLVRYGRVPHRFVCWWTCGGPFRDSLSLWWSDRQAARSGANDVEGEAPAAVREPLDPVALANLARLRAEMERDWEAGKPERARVLTATKDAILESAVMLRSLWTSAGLPDGCYGILKVRMFEGHALVTCERGHATGHKDRFRLPDSGRAATDFVARLERTESARYTKRDD